MTERETGRHKLIPGIRALVLWLSALPAIYVFVAIQYSAITVPFWDHAELIRWIASWYDGTFTIASLWAPHNQTRPLVYRAVMLFNAVLTGWDIRSEYVYMYAAIYGVFLVHLRALRRLTDTGIRLLFPASLLLMSLFVFSPAGHNNHWWSMMFQLNVANLLIAFGLLTVFLNPHRWRNHLFAAVSCWLAAYSLTNGIFAFLAIIATLQIASGSWRPNRYILFWVANLAVLLILYIPGIPLSSGPTHPTIGQLAWFSLVYVGTPFGSLLWFPFKSQFDIPIPTLFHGLCGIVLIVSAILLIWRAKERLRKYHAAALILIGFTIFAIISAVTTAWGRATFDSYGISNANSSRYTIFGVYLLFGLIYYVATGYAESWWQAFASGSPRLRWPAFGMIVGAALFVALAAISYYRAIPVYRDAHDTNLMLAGAYTWGTEPTEVDQFIYPNPEFVKELKQDLQRLQLGPYRTRTWNVENLPVGAYRRPFQLFGDQKLSQRFTASAAGLQAIGVTLVTWGNTQADYQVSWRLFALGNNQQNLVTAGTFSSSKALDWQPLWLQLPYLSDSGGHLYELEFSAPAKRDDQHVVGLALYDMNPAQTIMDPAVFTDQISSTPLTVQLRLQYAR